MRVSVTKESKTGRNLEFRDPTKKQEMSRAEFVKRIEKGEYKGYHIRKVNGTKTPASNPDSSEKNKLALILCIALDRKFEELFYFDE